MKKKGINLAYNTKVITTPTATEVYFYDKPIIRNEIISSPDICLDEKRKKSRREFNDFTALEQANSLKKKQNYYEQKRWDIARIIDCNFDSNTKFITLTFKENIIDIDFANKQFSNFIKRLNFHLYHTKILKTKYIATWEKQKRGSLHYHVVFFDFPYIKSKELENIWGHGFIKVNRVKVDDNVNIGRYVSKYFSKDLDLKEHKKKAFFMSTNLKKPKIEKMLCTTEELESLLKDKNIVFQKEYFRKVYDENTTLSKIGGITDSEVIYIKINNGMEAIY